MKSIQIKSSGSWRFVFVIGLMISAFMVCYVNHVRDASPAYDRTARIFALHVMPRSPRLVVYATQQLTATGTFSDRSKQDITTQVHWVSSARGIATVDDQGLVTAVAAGEATISVTRDAVRSATTLTVTAP
jgi:uncharacterized protein YjdB